MSFFIYVFTAIVAALVVTGGSLAATSETDQQSTKIESVLDKLETKYLDRENAPLTYDEQRTKSMNLPVKPIETVTIKREPIEGKTPNQKILKDIQSKINEYENQIDALEADSRKLKSQVVQGSTTDNMVTIEAKLKNQKTSGLQALTAKIDGSLLFNQVDPAGMWMPMTTISVYQGPMQPGEHTIDITAVLTKTNTNGLAVAGWPPQQVVKEFKISLPEGKVKKHIVIELDISSEQSGKAIASMTELDDEASRVKEAP